jgi:hypothetical protein
VAGGDHLIGSRYYQETSRNLETKHVENYNSRPKNRVGIIRRKLHLQWPAAGSEDTELGVMMEPEVCHGTTEVYARVQS